MKKLILTFLLFLSVISTVMAPPNKAVVIFNAPVITFYDAGWYTDLINVLFTHEAGRNVYAINAKEEAHGGLQIRPNRLEHYNKLTNSNYTLTDCFDFEISKKIFLYFCNHDSKGRIIPWKSWEQAAKDWNGSGPMTETYWEKVKQLI